MKRQSPLSAAMLLLLLAALPTSAQESPSIGVYFDPESLDTETSVESFTQFTWYVVALGVDAAGFEFGVTIPPEITVFDRSIIEESQAVVVGTDDFVLDLAQCSVDKTTLVSYVGFIPDPRVRFVQTGICVTSHVESTFVPANPGYLDCEGQARPLGLAVVGGSIREGCGAINLGGEGCLLIDDEPYVMLGHGSGPPGGLAELILRTASTGDQDCSGPQLNVMRLSFDVYMDTAVGVFEGTRLIEPAEGWATEVGPAEGDAAFSMTLSSEVGVLVDGGQQLRVALGFRLAELVGSTRVYLRNIRFGFPDGSEMVDPGPIINVSGMLAVQPVSTSSMSFGNLKSRF